MSDMPAYAPLPMEAPEDQAQRCGPGRPRQYDRLQALHALTRVFREKGFEATSVEDLTSAAGLSRSSFYHAFGSKRGALLAALEGHGACHRAALRRLAEAQPEDDPIARAKAVIDGHFNAEVAETGCFLGDMAAELGRREPDVAAVVDAHACRLMKDFSQLAAPLVGPVHAPARARAAYALALGAGVMRKSGAPPETLESLRQEARRLLGAA